MKKIKRMVSNFLKWFIKKPIYVKIALVLIIVVAGWFVFSKINKNKFTKVQYQTSIAEKGTLINSISGSGSITSGNYISLNTKVSGVVNNVYVTNGDKVVKGQKIADISLDDYAQERQTAAWVSYIDSTIAAKDAVTAKTTADIQMWKDREAVLNAQQTLNDKNDGKNNPATNKVYTDGEKMIVDKTLDQTRKAFVSSESRYLNADVYISNAYAKVSAALRNYQENSSTIITPASGTISDLMLTSGLILSANSSTSNTSGATIVSSQTIAKISNPNGQLIATVSLSEIDIISVKANQKVVLTLDAYPDMTFTGKVLAVNTNGSVSSGVTSYPVTILFDPVSVDIYPNMSVSAQIMTNIKTDVILVPITAITTANNQSTVKIMKDGNPISVNIEIGLSNDSQTEIISGINEGDEVIVSTITTGDTSQTKTSNTSSPFSGLGTRSPNSSGNRMIIQEGPRGF